MLLFLPQRSSAQFVQQGAKLVGSNTGSAQQGISVALSGDGNTAIIGGPSESPTGAAWVFARVNGEWIQQGNKLVGMGVIGLGANQGISVALSADGNTAIIGGPKDSYNFNGGATGAAWIFSRLDGVWTQQAKLVGSDGEGLPQQGSSVALSADGNTAVIGGPFDNGRMGAIWVFTRTSGAWTQQGPKQVGTGGKMDNDGYCVGSGEVHSCYGTAQGSAVAISADGNTVVIGGPGDLAAGSDSSPSCLSASSVGGFGGCIGGAAWVFGRTNGTWTQRGNRIEGTDAAGPVGQGTSVALSTDGNMASIFGFDQQGMQSTVWFFARSADAWTQMGTKFSSPNIAAAKSVAFSGDLTTAIFGLTKDGPLKDQFGFTTGCTVGAEQVFAFTAGAWSPQGTKLIGTGTLQGASQGYSVALSTGGSTAMAGGPTDGSICLFNNLPSGGTGAAWIYATTFGLSISESTGDVHFKQGQQGAALTITVTNNGPGATWGTTTVTNTVPTGLVPAGTSGTDWSCLINGQTVTCSSVHVVHGGSAYPPLIVNMNVAQNAPATVSNSGSVSYGASLRANSNVINVTIDPAPVLSAKKTHVGDFIQGQPGTWVVAITNTSTLSTAGVLTVTDSLPSGFTLDSFSGVDWTCSGATSVDCKNSDIVAGGLAYPTLNLVVNVPSSAPPTVSNTVSVSGGGAASTTSPSDVVNIKPNTQPTISLVASSATGAQPFAAGQLISIYGMRLGPSAPSGIQIGPDGAVTKSNGGTQILFDGSAAPILFASSGQVNAAIPCSGAGQPSTKMVLYYLAVPSVPTTLQLGAAAPGIYTLSGSGRGLAVVVNQDNSINSSSNAAPRGSVVTFYATGIGLTKPCVDGHIYSTDFPTPTLPVSVSVGDARAQVTYAGQLPGFISGAAQINAVIPNDAPTGVVALTLSVGGVTSPAGVTVAIQ